MVYVCVRAARTCEIFLSLLLLQPPSATDLPVTVVFHHEGLFRQTDLDFNRPALV